MCAKEFIVLNDKRIGEHKIRPWYWIYLWLLCRDRSAAARRCACFAIIIIIIIYHFHHYYYYHCHDIFRVHLETANTIGTHYSWWHLLSDNWMLVQLTIYLFIQTTNISYLWICFCGFFFLFYCMSYIMFSPYDQIVSRFE